MSEATTFIPPHVLKTAVLFLVFNRLDTTKQVFEAIRHAKPPRLYVAADGARANKEGEADKTQVVRDLSADKFTTAKVFSIENFIFRVYIRIKRVFIK